MAIWFHRIFLLLLVSSCVSSDFLENPDFESPPLNLSSNASSSALVLLDQNTTLPGWTFQGTVQYVTSPDLPHSGHVVQLGEDGKINQTFIAKGDDLNYILTFVLIPGGQNCSISAGLSVSGPDSNSVFSYRKNYSKVSWQSYSHILGKWRNGEPINLVLESQAIDSESNSTCWPIVDTLLIKTAGVTLDQDSDRGTKVNPRPWRLPKLTFEGVVSEVVSVDSSETRPSRLALSSTSMASDEASSLSSSCFSFDTRCR